jgi:hypothetical protein
LNRSFAPDYEDYRSEAVRPEFPFPFDSMDS